MARLAAPTSGDAFADLLGPRPQRPLAGMEAQDDAEENTFLNQEQGEIAKRRVNERAGLHAGEAEQAADQQKVAKYGTADPVEAARREASGIFGQDLAQQMRIDPEGTKAKVDRFTAIHDAASAPRVYRVGVGQHGEPYYTNLSANELQQESQGAAALMGKRNLPMTTEEGETETPPFAPPAHDLHETGMVDQASPEGERDPAKILFQGQLDKMKAIAGAPERADQHARDVEAYGQDLMDQKKYPTAEEALAVLHGDRQSGKLGKMNMKPQEEMALERQIAHFAVKPTQYQDMEPDDQVLYRPWTKPGADKASPATVTNPLGAMPPKQMLDTQHNEAMADHAAAIDESLPTEQVTGYQVAKQGYSATAKRMSKEARQAALKKAQAPANPLMGRLESDRQKEIAAAQQRLNEDL